MDFAMLLETEFLRRRHRNPRYSLRAFARSMGTDHATMSQLLRGLRRLSLRRIRTMGARLGLSDCQIEHCCTARADAAVLEAIRKPPMCIGSRKLARRVGINVDAINIVLHRLLVAGSLRMPAKDRWIAEEKKDA